MNLKHIRRGYLPWFRDADGTGAPEGPVLGRFAGGSPYPLECS